MTPPYRCPEGCNGTFSTKERLRDHHYHSHVKNPGTEDDDVNIHVDFVLFEKYKELGFSETELYSAKFPDMMECYGICDEGSSQLAHLSQDMINDFAKESKSAPKIKLLLPEKLDSVLKKKTTSEAQRLDIYKDGCAKVESDKRTQQGKKE